MKKLLLIYIFVYQCFAFSQQTTKKYSVLKSTITSVGSATIYTTNNNYSVQQSIGQSGIIGTKKTEKVSVQQGFLTSTLFFKVDNSSENTFKETLDFVISPNPFIDYIKIDFAKKTTYDVYIKIFDVNGKVFNSEKHQPTDQIIIPMNRFSIGTYLIQIKSGENSSTKKILKVQ